MAKPAVYTWPAANTTLIAPLQSITAQNTIALLQDIAGQGNLILNGITVNATGKAIIPGPPQLVSISSANDLSGVNFVLIGYDINGNKIGESIVGPNNTTVFSTLSYATISSVSTDAAANGITVGAVTPLTLTSSIFQYNGISRAVSVKSTNNLSASTFVITGTLNNVVVSQSIAGPNNTTSYTTQLFDTVTQVTVNKNVVAVSIGSGLLGYTHWYLYNYHASVVGFTAEVDVAATTVNYTFETTLDDVTNPTYAPVLNSNIFAPIAAMTGAATSQFAPYNNVMRYSRIIMLAGTTATGSLTATFLQQGIT